MTEDELWEAMKPRIEALLDAREIEKNIRLGEQLIEIAKASGREIDLRRENLITAINMRQSDERD